jgi:hypothetical protein
MIARSSRCSSSRQTLRSYPRNGRRELDWNWAVTQEEAGKDVRDSYRAAARDFEQALRLSRADAADLERKIAITKAKSR